MKITNQHGDLLFAKADGIPPGAKRVDIAPGYVLERGEGVHLHTLEDIEGVEVFEEGGEIYVRVGIAARINHQEHGVQVLEPGTYKKANEVEWGYENEEARKVMD